MSYIDALYKKDEDKIYVVERDPKKGRVFVEYDARYVFYYCLLYTSDAADE